MSLMDSQPKKKHSDDVSSDEEIRWSIFAIHSFNQAYLYGTRDRPYLNDEDTLFILAVADVIGPLEILWLLRNPPSEFHVEWLMPFFMIGLAYYWIESWVALRRYRLATKGNISEGVVLCTHLAWRWSTYGIQQKLIVQYQFIAPNGVTIHGKTSTSRYRLRYKSLPPKGTPIKVVYLNDHYHQAV